MPPIYLFSRYMKNTDFNFLVPMFLSKCFIGNGDIYVLCFEKKNKNCDLLNFFCGYFLR